MAGRDPAQGFTFLVECGGIKGYFTSIDGLGSENEVAVYKAADATGKEVQLKQAGRLNWGDVTLKRGLTGDMSFWAWRQDIIDGKVGASRKAMTITLLDREYAPLTSWNIINAWPSKISAASFSVDSNDVQVEEVTFVHEGVTRAGASGGSVAA
jgi:phage tail-like protein